VARYDHLAVFRQPDVWSEDRIEGLRLFIDRVIASGAKYNFLGIGRFKKRKEIHDLTLHDQLRAFFDGKLEPVSSDKGKYFCSELVADCFVATGILDPSAAVMYKSDVTSPGDLGKDPTFGTFFGYISVVEGYLVPSTDDFINASTFDELFN